MRLGIVIAVAAAGLATAGWAQTFEVFGTNATWAYFKGTREASAPDPKAWRQLGFDDAGWARGMAPFFYGEPLAGGTRLDDMQNAYTTLFLRRAFVVSGAADIAGLELWAACDDGFIAWINGVEVARWRAPAGEPLATSLASENAVPDPAVFEGFWLGEPSAYLGEGTNVLAVQVFNVSVASSDLVFTAGLGGTWAARVAPTVAGVWPEAGPLTGLTTVTVTFSEPVTGVDAGDLLLNELACVAVEGDGAVYTFTCPALPLGAVLASWVPEPGIRDRSAEPVAFDPHGVGARWLYELYDPNAPRVVSTHPADGATVRQLDRAEVVFSRQVTGVEAGDLLVNGVPAARVVGAGAGPYLFEFSPVGAGAVEFGWASGHGITDQAAVPVAFGGGSWGAWVDPSLPRPAVVIQEFLAENVGGLMDEDGDREDWIELYNASAEAVDLAGWSLSDDARWPRQWVFPSVVMGPGSYLVVYASGKDRRTVGGNARLHTNFKLAVDGEYLGLYGPESLREAASEVAPGYPEQRADYGYGREAGGGWRYLSPPTPGAANAGSAMVGVMEEVHFSAGRGFYAKPFNLTLACATPGATIRYTTNGSVPALTNGVVYTQPIPINASRILRAAAFGEGRLPSRVTTHTYLYNLPASRRLLPALSVVTATNHLYGRNGIMEVNPRNTTKHGVAWERPVSVEFIRPGDHGGFQVDCGMRVQGGDYIRGLYDYRSGALPQSKYSFRLYFRGDYGPGRLNYRWFPETTQASFDTVVLRAGMNDHSNPFLTDEFVRTLARDCGQPAPVGTFVHFFLNGVYKGVYNPCERIDPDFLRAYHGEVADWDIVAQFGEVREGDVSAWNSLKTFVSRSNLSVPTNYLEVARQMDLTNFVDYLAPLIYVDNDDWPHNNWRAARTRTPGGPFRFYAWDAEWACGVVNGHAPSFNTINSQLSSTTPPWGTAEIAQIFNKLKVTTEFKLLFADRVHRHFFNGGPLTDARIRDRYEETKARLNGAISGFNNVIGSVWIPNRRRYLLDYLHRAGFLGSSNAPVFGQFGGRVAPGFRLTMTNLMGPIYYTLDGSDPRTSFTGFVGPGALAYDPSQPPVLAASTGVKARSYWVTNAGTARLTNWSALTEARFEVALAGWPLRFSEIHYHPPEGDAYEFIELVNLSPLPLDVSGVSLEGVSFRFPEGTVCGGSARWVLASDASPGLFAQRYPGVAVAGWFGGSLANGGERLAMVDRDGVVLVSVDYSDGGGWAAAADGDGASLEAVDPAGNLDDPANWVGSERAGGTPGDAFAAGPAPLVRLNEVAAAVGPDRPSGGLTNDWIELHNAGAVGVDLAGWTLDDGGGTSWVFPSAVLPAGGYAVVHARAETGSGGWEAGFALDAGGETVFLHDAQGRRVDAVGFGLQIPGYTLGRGGEEAGWGLAEPTPGGPNEQAGLGAVESLVINEVLPNPEGGGDDWIELHNRDGERPVGLRGVGLSATNAFQRLEAWSFIEAGGFAVIRADGGAGAGHVKFKLPAARGHVAWVDPLGIERQRVLYTNAVEGVSLGLLPDGVGGWQAFPGSASPGSSNYVRVVTGVRLNEMLAASREQPSDWVELFNPTAESVEMGGMRLVWEEGGAGWWPIPAGVRVPAGGYLVVACDPTRPASTVAESALNCGHGLSAGGGMLGLANAAGRWLDRLDYGPQLPDRSVGLSGGGWGLLAGPTPGATNEAPALLGEVAQVRLNEWQAGGGEDDWFELFNRDVLPVNLGGCVLTDDPSLAGQTNHTIRPLSFVAGGGWLRWVADGNPDEGPDHVPFRLNVLGETLRLYRANFGVVDSVDFGALRPGVAQGRFPDGEAVLVEFPETASPGGPNWLPLGGVVINELLAHTDPPFEDAIELANLGSTAVDVGGWWLSDDRGRPRKYQIPAGTILEAGGYGVVYQGQFDVGLGVPASFRLDPDRAGEVVLAQAGPDGELTGYRAVVALGASDNGISFGRHRTSLGDDYTFLSGPSFGVDSPATVEAFRAGRGAPNGAPRVGPVVVNEIMYQPATSLSQPEEAWLEYVELHNLTDQPQPLWRAGALTVGWRLRSGVEIDFAAVGATVAPRGFLVVVGFDPRTNAAAVSAFLAHYGLEPAMAGSLVGPFSGRLRNEGETLRVDRPGDPFLDGTEWFVPRIEVDRVGYGHGGSWPQPAAGTGLSLQRVQPGLYGNDPAHWLAARPTPGAINAQAGGDADGDGLPDDWEALHGFDVFSAEGDAGAGGDADGDGLTNLEEWQWGTDPRAVSIRIAGLRFQGVGVRIQFNAAAAVTYRVEYATALDPPEWKVVRTYGPQPSAGLAEAVLPVSEVDPIRFFRVAVQE